jgi:nucleoside 2-deoxyribosyltransferase
MKPFIYLAGPIAGCTEGEAKDWRAYVNTKLEAINCVGVSPLRCEPLIGARYELSYQDPLFGQPKSIIAKNFLDLRRCDMTLAYFPVPPESKALEEIATRMGNLSEIIEKMIGPLDDEEGKAIIDDAKTLERIARKSPQRSVGTIGEISWAYALRKPCVIVTEDPLLTAHPFISQQPDWPVLKTLDEAVLLIAGIFGAYNGGKNV